MLARRSFLAAALAAATPLPAFAQHRVPALPPPLSSIADVSVRHFDGAATTLGAVLSPGCAAVISFWATWCPPCAMEARHLARLRSRVSPERLRIIGVNVDTRPNEAAIQRFLRNAGANYTQLRGDRAAYAAFGYGETIELPRLFVFAPDGRPLAAFDRYLGEASSRAIDQAVAEALAV
jgi:thiol-disulfide isomerase/thioredoxin